MTVAKNTWKKFTDESVKFEYFRGNQLTMKSYLLFVLLLYCTMSSAQEESAWEFQHKLNEAFADSIHSPLMEKDRRAFSQLPFFPIDSTFIIKASFKRTANSQPFKMKTTTDRLPVYEKYGEAHFQIEGKNFLLNIYQNHQLREQEEYKDYLFLPFTDATNGEETYGGGRFLDLKIPTTDTLLIDFNKAYNPYCAYNHKYSCPVPPKENDLNIRITAGVKYKQH